MGPGFLLGCQQPYKQNGIAICSAWKQEKQEAFGYDHGQLCLIVIVSLCMILTPILHGWHVSALLGLILYFKLCSSLRICNSRSIECRIYFNHGIAGPDFITPWYWPFNIFHHIVLQYVLHDWDWAYLIPVWTLVCWIYVRFYLTVLANPLFAIPKGPVAVNMCLSLWFSYLNDTKPETLHIAYCFA